MKLTHSDLHFTINITENRFPIVILERSDLYHQFITALCDQSEGFPGRFVLSDDWEPLDIGKSIVVTTDLFHIEINGRKQISALTKQLNALMLSEHHFQSTNSLQDYIYKWALELENDIPCATVHNETIDMNAVLKTLGIKFDDEIADLSERICSFIKICAEYLHIRLYVTVGLHEHMTDSALNALYKTAMYEKLPILDIERYIPETKLACEQYYIIDRDNCQIYNKSDLESF